MGLGDKMFKGIAWSAVERLSIQAIQFIIQIALARILTPSEYGTVGILYVFIVISTVFIDSGFTKALIQKKIELKMIFQRFSYSILASALLPILFYMWPLPL